MDAILGSRIAGPAGAITVIRKTDIPQLPDLLRFIPTGGRPNLDGGAIGRDIRPHHRVARVFDRLMNYPAQSIEIANDIIIEKQLPFTGLDNRRRIRKVIRQFRLHHARKDRSTNENGSELQSLMP